MGWPPTYACPRHGAGVPTYTDWPDAYNTLVSVRCGATVDTDHDGIIAIPCGRPVEQQSPGGHHAVSHPEAYTTSVPGGET